MNMSGRHTVVRFTVAAVVTLFFMFLVAPVALAQDAPDVAPTAVTTASVAITATTPASVTYTRVAAGSAHTCALGSDGFMRCWGLNALGQVGDGTFVARHVPVTVANVLTDVVDFDARSFGSMAVTADGGLWHWGNVMLLPWMSEPTLFDRDLNIAFDAVSLNYSHFCALSGGDAYCFGMNYDGELGDGTTDTSDNLVKVVGIDEPIQQMSVGGGYTCAVLESGTVKCWGQNWAGQLGDGTQEASSSPVTVIGLSESASEVQAGSDFTCAVLQSGGVKCWGYVEYPQSSPIAIQGLVEPVEKLSIGRGFACALSAGSIQCWGENESGQLGVPASEPVWNAGAPVDLPGKAIDVSVGDHHTCAVLEDGSIHCWGSDQRGQLGRNRQAERPIPVAVAQPLIVTQVAVGGTGYGQSFTCAVFAPEGALRCWGANDAGTLGLGEEAATVSRPTLVTGLESGIVQVVAGQEHVCALNSDGEVSCWGANWSGQLGSSVEFALTPLQVTGLGGRVSSISAGDRYTCALLEDGSVRCWGAIVPGMENGRAVKYSMTPVTPAGLETGVQHIVGGGGHACALLEDGALLCWGSNNSGQIGNGEQGYDLVAPTEVALDATPATMALGVDFTCALMPNADTTCWGGGSSVWMQPVSRSSNGLTPTVVSHLPTDIQSLAAGGDNLCTVSSKGALACLGDNEFGLLGNGQADSLANRLTPVIGMSSGVASIAIAETHACAILDGGNLWCWGSDGDGQLGLGITGRLASPSPVEAAPVTDALLSAQTAAPGSILTLSAFNFAPEQDVSIAVNGKVLKATTPITATASGASSLFINTAGAKPGYYRIEISSAPALTTSAPISTGVDLILTKTAPLLAQQGGGLPRIALLTVAPRDASLAPRSAPIILLTISTGANLRRTPAGDIQGNATAGMQVIYDAATAATVTNPLELQVPGNDGLVTLQGQGIDNNPWVPVLLASGETAWVGAVVIESASTE